MNRLIEDIITELRTKYGYSRLEIERVIDSQFRLTRQIISDRNCVKDVKWMYLGEIRKSNYIKKLIERNERLAKQTNTNK